MPVPSLLYPFSYANHCPVTKDSLPSWQTNQASKFNSCLQPRKLKMIKHLIKAHVSFTEWEAHSFAVNVKSIQVTDLTQRGTSYPVPASPVSFLAGVPLYCSEVLDGN